MTGMYVTCKRKIFVGSATLSYFLHCLAGMYPMIHSRPGPRSEHIVLKKFFSKHKRKHATEHACAEYIIVCSYLDSRVKLCDCCRRSNDSIGWWFLGQNAKSRWTTYAMKGSGLGFRWDWEQMVAERLCHTVIKNFAWWREANERRLVLTMSRAGGKATCWRAVHEQAATSETKAQVVTISFTSALGMSTNISNNSRWPLGWGTPQGRWLGWRGGRVTSVAGKKVHILGKEKSWHGYVDVLNE